MTSREHLAILSRLEQAELKLNQLWQAHNSAEKDRGEVAGRDAAFRASVHDRLLTLETAPKRKGWKFWK